MTSDLARAIEAAWEQRDSLTVGSQGAARDAVEAALKVACASPKRSTANGPCMNG